MRWAQEHAIAVVEIAAYQTVQRIGRAPHDMAIFDLSAENGDTPIVELESQLSEKLARRSEVEADLGAEPVDALIARVQAAVSARSGVEGE